MKIQLPVRVDKNVWESIKKLAVDDNRTPSNYVDTLLKNHVSIKEKGQTKNKK